MVTILSHSVILGFLDRDYHYKSRATQIRHDAGLTPIPYIRKFLPHRESNLRRPPYYEFKAVRLKLRDHGPSL